MIEDDPFVEVIKIADTLNRSYPAVRNLIVKWGLKKYGYDKKRRKH